MISNKHTVFALLVGTVLVVSAVGYPMDTDEDDGWIEKTKELVKSDGGTLPKNSNDKLLNTDKNSTENVGRVRKFGRWLKNKLSWKTTATENPTTIVTSDFAAEDDSYVELSPAVAKTDKRTAIQKCKDKIIGLFTWPVNVKTTTTKKPMTAEIDDSSSPQPSIVSVTEEDDGYIPNDDQDFTIVDLSVTLYPESVSETTTSMTITVPVHPNDPVIDIRNKI